MTASLLAAFGDIDSVTSVEFSGFAEARVAVRLAYFFFVNDIAQATRVKPATIGTTPYSKRLIDQ